MGNCQAAEASTVLIQHPGGKIERIYWSLTASQIMASNPGHYVAVIIAAKPSATNSGGGAAAPPVKHLKLLRPDDTLRIGHAYRLVSFQEVLKEFAAKKHVRLSRLVGAAKERRRSRSRRGDGDPMPDAAGDASSMPAREAASDGETGGEAAAPPPRVRQWRPALQSIEEVVGS